MGQFHFRPEQYLALMESEMPGYRRLQDAAAAATGGGPAGTIAPRGGAARTGAPRGGAAGTVAPRGGVARILELGTGTGETSRRVLARHPGAALVGVDASAEMLAAARAVLPGADLRVARLEDPLPGGPFDLVVSVLAVHHLDGPGKADLFARVAEALAPGGRFVLGDVVVPDDPADATTPLSPGFDLPSRTGEQLAWLREAGLDASLAWAERDLAVLVGVAAADGNGAG